MCQEVRSGYHKSTNRPSDSRIKDGWIAFGMGLKDRLSFSESKSVVMVMVMVMVRVMAGQRRQIFLWSWRRALSAVLTLSSDTAGLAGLIHNWKSRRRPTAAGVCWVPHGRQRSGVSY